MRKILYLLCVLISISANAQKKVALVIGNGEYNGKGNGTGYFSKLSPIPENDAKDVGNVLDALGYDVTTITDVKRDTISQLLADLRTKARGADEVLVYYSGHGAWKNDEYYLVPSGAYTYSETLESDCYSYKSLENMVANIQAPLRMIFIDACQNDISGKKGVVRPRTERDFEKNTQAMGLYRFFATGKGEFANIGNEHSIFTGAFLNHIGENSGFDRVWKNICNEVLQKNPEQTPYFVAPDSKESPDEQIRKIVFNPQKVNTHPIAEGKQQITFELNPPTAIISFEEKSYPSGTSLQFKLNQGYKFKVEAEGYETYENTLTATPRTPNVMPITLTKKEEAKLQVTCNTPDVQITFDDKELKFQRTPITLEAYAGVHNLTAQKKGFNSYKTTLNLKGGSNSHNIVLARQKPWFWDYDDDAAFTMSYHFSPQYEFGISGLWKIEDSRFSLGGLLALSSGVFRDLSGESNTSSHSTSSSTSEDSEYETETILFNGKGEAYSSLIDPYNEAKHYNGNALVLVDAGYHVCNGLMFDLGLGMGYHSGKYYMPNTYTIEQTTTTNKLTGEQKTNLNYIKNEDDGWYREDDKYSPAIRLGAKAFIPLDRFKETMLSVGAAYICVPMISKISSWDISIGFTKVY